MFIPIGDDNSRRETTPIIVYLLIAANFAVWMKQLSLGDAFTMGYSTIPYELTHGVDLAGMHIVRAGDEAVRMDFYPGPHPIYLTALSSMFMHGSWMHILGNMLYLWIFGDQIEDLLGHGKFLLFYLLCGLAADAAQVMAAPDSLIPCLGASGAIAGVLGAYLVRFGSNPVRVLTNRGVANVSAIYVLGFWIVLQFLGQAGSATGVQSGVAYLAHIGGFIAGIVLVFVVPRRSAGQRFDWQ